jgi:F420H(2)-dependent quinone reductase
MITQNTSSILHQRPTVPHWVNRFVTGLLRSPFHMLMSHKTMLLMFSGRTSGRRYTIPVRYIREEQTVFTVTSRPWWRNLRGGVPVDVFVAGQNRQGHAEVKTDAEDVERGMRALLHLVPADAPFYQVRLDRHKQPEITSLKHAAQSLVLVTIQLENPD